MKKLKLKLDDIHVTGFEVAPPEADGAGTVKGAEALTRYTYCDWHETCWQTCALTCDPGLC